MKATVMESKNKKTVALTEDGSFVRIFGNYEVGAVVDYTERRPSKHFPGARFVAAACAAVVIAGGAFGYWQTAAYASVTVGETAPVTLHVNRQNKVVRVETADDAGSLTKDLAASDLTGQSLDDAITQAEKIMKMQYPDDAEQVTVSCRNEKKKLELENEIREYKDGQTAPEKSDPKTPRHYAKSEQNAKKDAATPKKETTGSHSDKEASKHDSSIRRQHDSKDEKTSDADHGTRNIGDDGISGDGVRSDNLQ